VNRHNYVFVLAHQAIPDKKAMPDFPDFLDLKDHTAKMDFLGCLAHLGPKDKRLGFCHYFD
jgi:hypothetical protein